MKKSNKMIILRLVGGLGNQLFQYAAARRLAINNNVPLKLDTISGFQSDPFKRSYLLNLFLIEENLAVSKDCFLGGLGRLQRWMLRKLNKHRPFKKRSYIRETFFNCDDRLLDFEVRGKTYLEGYWQSEKYFKDIEGQIRKEFRFKDPHEPSNMVLANKINGCESVCIHVRQLLRFRLDMDYYSRAIKCIKERIKNPHFFIFSDCPVWVKETFKFDDPVTFVEHNYKGRDHEDLWLMSRCKYFVIANSSFSWWGAWLSSFDKKIVCAPSKGFDNDVDMIPEGWVVL